MEGNYRFMWAAIAATGICEGEYSQTIYGKTLAEACAYFESFHGPLSPNEDGVCLVIRGIVWQP